MISRLTVYVCLFCLAILIGCQGDTNSNENASAETQPKKEAPAVKQKENDGQIYTISVADLVGNPGKYSGQTVKLTGECTKVNAQIMGRNWIHIKDGSKDDYDLVITSDQEVPVGENFSMVGKVTLDKDFGAGYTYDIIVEEGEVVD